jgi:hypothetical protein
MPLTLGALGLLVTGLAACNDFLDTNPRGTLTTEDFFQTADHAVQATNATYNMLREWQVHVFSWIGLTDIASDDATKGSTPGDAGFLGDLDALTFDPGNLAFRDPWIGYYRGIYRANVAIENIPNVDMDPELQARLVAENKFLRAYYYFFLARSFGGVPLITQPLRPGEFFQPRATADQVYALIVQDLLDAIPALPATYDPADLGRATVGAARGLLAQVYLHRGDYPNALAQAEAVITSGYQLHPDYAALFTPAGENSSESVFEVQAVALSEGGAGSQYAQVQGVRGTPNIGWGFNTPSPELEAAYEPGDPRLQATILFPWEMIPDGTGRVVYLNPSMMNNRYNQKVFISPETPQGSGNGGVNIRRVRLGDVLLIAAEAAYQTGAAGPAQQYLNQVRARARGGRTVTLGFTPEDLAQPILVDVLGQDPADSRVFARSVNPDGAAFAAGLRGMTSECADGVCASAAVPPVRVTSIDLIQQVDGTPVTTADEYLAALEAATPGQDVSLDVLRVTQDAGGSTSTQAVTVTIQAEPLLPDVTATGQALLDAIWHERRVELAMEQHRWFDIRRQNAVQPGRAAQLMAVAGLTFIEGRHELYPIPAAEVEIAGLTQNPGY